MSRVTAFSLLSTIALTALFLTVLTREEPTLLSPLVNGELVLEPRRTDRVVTDGVTLEGTLRTDLSPDRPYILHGTVIIPQGTTVTVHPGTAVFVARDGGVLVEGTLVVHPSTWSSNQRHPSRRYWHGIAGAPGSSITLRGAAIHDATAALTCATGSTITVAGSTFANNVVGVVTLPRSVCTIEDSRVERGRVGIHVVGGTPTITGVTFDRLADGIRVFHEGTPNLQRLTMSRITDAVIRSSAVSDLVIRGLTAHSSRPLTDLIVDGTDTPTHLWNNEEHPTGRVTVE